MFSRLSTGTREQSGQAAASRRPLTWWRIARGIVQLVAQAVQAQMAIALLMPVLWGVALAKWETGTVGIWRTAYLLFTFGALALARNLFSSYIDFRRCLQWEGPPPPAESRAEGTEATPTFDGYDILYAGYLHPSTFLSLGLMAATIFGLASLWLGLVVGWPFWFFAGLSALLTAVSLLPVLQSSRRFCLLSDVALWGGMGLLPMLGAYHALTDTVSQTALWAAIAPATFTWLASLALHFYNWHRDWRLHKKNLVILLGPERALDVAAIVAVIGFATMILLMATGAVPLWTLLVLGALPLFLRAFTRNQGWPFSRAAGMHTAEHAVNATVLAGVLWLLALWLP